MNKSFFLMTFLSYNWWREFNKTQLILGFAKQAHKRNIVTKIEVDTILTDKTWISFKSGSIVALCVKPAAGTFKRKIVILNSVQFVFYYFFLNAEG